MKRLFVLLLAAALALGTVTAFAATLTVGSHHLWAGKQTLTKGSCTLTGTAQSVDTYVDESKPTTNFATGTTLQTMPDTNKRKWSLIRFDLTSCSLPTTGGADSATLSLRITTAPTASRTLTLTPITSTWAATATWNTVPIFAAADTTTFATGTAKNVTVSVPVTVDVDALIKSSTANYGWRIADLGTAAAGDTTQMASSNATSNKPQLVITYEK